MFFYAHMPMESIKFLAHTHKYIAFNIDFFDVYNLKKEYPIALLSFYFNLIDNSVSYYICI